MRAWAVVRRSRLLAISLLLFLALSGLVHGLSIADVYVPLDGTFRDARDLSRHERAMLLTQRFSALGRTHAEFVRTQARELSSELTALGFDSTLLATPPAGWATLPARTSWDDAEWGRTTRQDWTVTRMQGVDAFWTDLASPLLRDAIAAEATGQPRIAPPRSDRTHLLDPWSPPSPEEDFTMSSPASVLPTNERIAFEGGLALDFAFAPHGRALDAGLPAVVDADGPMALLPANSTTLDELARLGLPAPREQTERPVASPLLNRVPLDLQTPRLQATAAPVVAEPFAVGSWAGAPPPLPPPLHLYSTWEYPLMLGGISSGEGLFSDDSRLLFRAPPSGAYTHLSASAGYRLPVRSFRLDLKLDEWKLGDPLSTANTHNLGLDRLRQQDARLDLDFRLDPKLSLQGGYIYTRASGTTNGGLDSGGLNVTQDRAFPYLGVDYKLSNDTRWKVNIRFYNTPLDITTTGLPRNGLNLNDPQLTTEVKVRF